MRGSSYWFSYKVSVQILDTAFGKIWTRLLRFSMSRIWTRLGPEIVLEAENVTGGFLFAGHLVDPSLPQDQPRSFQFFEVSVQLRAGDFGIGRQLVLRRETPEIRVVPIAEIPEHQLGHGAQPALLDCPVGGLVAHSAAVTVRRLTIAAIRAMRRSASAWRIVPARTLAQ